MRGQPWCRGSGGTSMCTGLGGRSGGVGQGGGLKRWEEPGRKGWFRDLF